MSALDLDIDLDSWEVTLLPLPKRHSRGAAYGFCGGHPVGRVERLRSPAVGCWWPELAAELLALPGVERVMAGHASGDWIPGNHSGDQGELGAVRWRLRDGQLLGERLDEPRLARHWATAAGGEGVIGVGAPRPAGQARAADVGFVWGGDGAVELMSAGSDVVLNASDGTRLGGHIRGRAALWPDASSAPLDLAPQGTTMSEVRALDGETQVGTAWRGMRPRAALWRGAAESYRDLTPPGCQVAALLDAAGGFQVGQVRTRENTPNGTPGSDDRAAIWQGSAERCFDLNALLPPGRYNASVALAIEIRGGQVRVCGEARRVEVQNPGTPHESHAVPVQHPVLWTARRRGG